MKEKLIHEKIKTKALKHILLLIGLAVITTGGYWGCVLLLSNLFDGWGAVIFIVSSLIAMVYYIYRDECKELQRQKT